MKNSPLVSLILPIRNESPYIERCLDTILAQDYPGKMEILIADGMSTDGTREILDCWAIAHPHVPLTIIDNPNKIVSTGLNLTLAKSHGDVIVRMDAHCEYPIDYIRNVVKLREITNADNAGGVLVPTGTTYTQRSISAAYYSPIGIGGAQKGHRTSKEVREVDAVWGGCWRRERLIAAGLFDEMMVRNQDDELSFRLRSLGGRVVQSQAIRVKYYVRDSFYKLFMQFAQYGYWKVRVIQKYPKQASLRHLIPALLVLTLITLTFMSPFHVYLFLGLCFVLGGYMIMIAITSLVEAVRMEWYLWPGIMLALISMHFGYGLGFIAGVIRWIFGSSPIDPIFNELTR